MKHKLILILVSGLCLIGCSREKTMDPLTTAYARLQAIPQQEWDALAQKKIYFGHQSVGYNIIAGLEDVLRRSPMIRLNIRETSAVEDFGSPVFAHSPIGTNRDPIGKIGQFRSLLEGGIGDKADIAFFKFCYVDIDPATDIEGLMSSYDQAIADLRARFPRLEIVPVTVPLTTSVPGLGARLKGMAKRLLGRGISVRTENVPRNLVNAHLRTQYGPSLWDLADVETTGPDGRKSSFQDPRGTFFLLSPPLTSDGGHLNSLGSQIVAIDLLVRLVRGGSR